MVNICILYKPIITNYTATTIREKEEEGLKYWTTISIYNNIEMKKI